MRTTIRLDDALLRQAKAAAAAAGRSLNDFIADAVRAALAHRPERAARPALPTFAGRGLHAGVDLDDSAALLEHMETEARFTYQARPQRIAKVAERRRRGGR